jgi:exosome complex exonuclease DIS3/RRP44
VASLTYDEAQIILDDEANIKDAVNQSVKLLNKLAHILRSRRIEAGALTLASPEVRFKLDVENQNPTDVSMYQLKESNALVEEWMLLANITVRLIVYHLSNIKLCYQL